MSLLFSETFCPCQGSVADLKCPRLREIEMTALRDHPATAETKITIIDHSTSSCTCSSGDAIATELGSGIVDSNGYIKNKFACDDHFVTDHTGGRSFRLDTTLPKPLSPSAGCGIDPTSAMPSGGSIPVLPACKSAPIDATKPMKSSRTAWALSLAKEAGLRWTQRQAQHCNQTSELMADG